MILEGWKTYLEKIYHYNVLRTPKRVEVINKREFTVVGVIKNAKTFLVDFVALFAISIYLNKKAQIKVLIAKKTFPKVPKKYLVYVGIFLLNLPIELVDHNEINNHSINFVKKKTTIL